MTDTTGKLRAVLLTALMVGSVIGAGVAFTGGAAAANQERLNQYQRFDDASNPGYTYNTASVEGKTEGSVASGATIFQGEEDITFRNSTNLKEVSPPTISRTGGSDEGVPLQMPIPEDQSTGSYDKNGPDSDDGGFNVTVQSPSVTMLEIRNNADNDVTGGVLNTQQTKSTIAVDYNYYAAEDIELTVEDEDGLDVTDEILDSSQSDGADKDGTGNNGADTLRFDINPNNVDAGDYTVSVEGVEDLDFGDATESVSVTISSSNKASLNLAEDEVVQGANLKYTIENSPEGNYHAVTIDSSDFRDNSNAAEAAKVMRSVGDTLDTGVVKDNGLLTKNLEDTDANSTDYAYAIVEIDDGNGVGSIETQYLDDSSVDIDLYPASSNTDDGETEYVKSEELDSVTALNERSTDDDTDFDVTQGDITLDNPSGAYVVGSEVDINGTANEGTDDVVLYARDNNDFELVTVDGENSTEVDSDDTFEEEDVTLSDGDEGGDDILGLPGTYRLGIIAKSDAVNSNGNVKENIDTSEFNQGVSSTSSIRVTDTELTASFETYNGQVADDDGQIDVEGTAPGKDNVAAVIIGNRGTVKFQSISVDSDDTFDEEDIDISELRQGSASAHILSSGRDGKFGEETASDIDQLRDVIKGTSDEYDGYTAGSPTGDQIRDRILANTVDDTASDDLMVTQQFRLVDGLTTIEATEGGEAGGTLTVMGTTNRKADDNTITVELLQGDRSVEINSTEEWNNDGQWSVDVPLSNVEPGNYTVEADDGDNTDRQDVEIVEELEEPDQTTVDQPENNQTMTTTMTETTTETTTEMTTTQENTTENGSEGTDDESSGSIPGFGVGVALVAVLGAALLALRQN
ncbi:HVO_2072 family ArtA-dependent S-layer glycoprotein [Halobacterium salinarum]|uniref:HVO_2072 family ArtA-dependent S-layer glycoprotein n=1 Tax=Halobacterium salinarum TaxID=2242 RepID=UPI0025540DFE|nr:HVO_2072 family ArtA-dependent S-layer glycoprotein [Halobacterium salinarum]MDL0143517.1 HVO_2072 family ArtA-dependent S-layer glycoprotein [Halobacterium salinarum]